MKIIPVKLQLIKFEQLIRKELLRGLVRLTKELKIPYALSFKGYSQNNSGITSKDRSYGA